jgi:hypothetical protein
MTVMFAKEAWEPYVEIIRSHGCPEEFLDELMLEAGYPAAYEPWFIAAGNAAAAIGADVHEPQDEIPSPASEFQYLLNMLSNGLYDGGLHDEKQCAVTVDNLENLARLAVVVRDWALERISRDTGDCKLMQAVEKVFGRPT